MSARIVMKLRVVARRDGRGGVAVFDFRHPNKERLPAWTPGAHVDLRLPDGRVRQYSLIGDPEDLSCYRIAVKREAGGRGGSMWLHEALNVGDEAHVSAPRNNFPLAEGAEASILIAGGIGVTPMVSMARALARAGSPFALHYCVRDRGAAPLLDMLHEICPLGALTLHVSGQNRLDVDALLAETSGNTHVYCCGPETLVDAVERAGACWPEEAMHFEVFNAALDENYKAEPFDLTVASTGQTFRVPADKSALDVLRAEGFVLPSSCELGVCGTCECGYRDGAVIHRDKVLRPSARQSRMMLCVSRGRVAITVDL